MASTGASVAAVSVDPPQISQNLRTQLALPFQVLCDTEHRVIADWDILNARERGGIARPAVFIIDPGRVIRFAATDVVMRRVPAAEIVSLLQQPSVGKSVRRKIYFPLLSNLVNAIRNNVRR